MRVCRDNLNMAHGNPSDARFVVQTFPVSIRLQNESVCAVRVNHGMLFTKFHSNTIDMTLMSLGYQGEDANINTVVVSHVCHVLMCTFLYMCIQIRAFPGERIRMNVIAFDELNIPTATVVVYQDDSASSLSGESSVSVYIHIGMIFMWHTQCISSLLCSITCTRFLLMSLLYILILFLICCFSY